MKTVVVIPARLKSTRLPDKILINIEGKPLIQRTFEACKGSKLSNEIYIAVDDVQVEQVCRRFTDKIIMTSTNHISGTSRLSEAAKFIETEVVINVQGDEPFINPKTIDLMIDAFNADNNINIASAYSYINSEEDLNNPNLVKVITNLNDEAIYFSRHAIPYDRDHSDFKVDLYKKHIGIYGYKKSFLEHFDQLKYSILENIEKLEQLRFLENGYKIRMIEVKSFEKGIDTNEDLEWARLEFRKKNEHQSLP